MRRTPKLQLVGRAYSEMSPLNPDPLTDSPTTSSAGQDRRGDQSGYGSIFPFGLLRGSFGRGGNASQYIFSIDCKAAFKTELSGESLAKMFKSRLKRIRVGVRCVPGAMCPR
ncbi:GD11584 [Drosophila simulans]|uniref:GD11584 n=1 Tax=Drosophila simulans TaxID=7240 RepID=B4QG14_DROSI|nr:GD11584 [Drosophila simulans]